MLDGFADVLGVDIIAACELSIRAYRKLFDLEVFAAVFAYPDVFARAVVDAFLADLRGRVFVHIFGQSSKWMVESPATSV